MTFFFHLWIIKTEAEDATQSKREECQNEMYNHDEGSKEQVLKQIMRIEQQRNDIQVICSVIILAAIYKFR